MMTHEVPSIFPLFLNKEYLPILPVFPDNSTGHAHCELILSSEAVHGGQEGVGACCQVQAVHLAVPGVGDDHVGVVQGLGVADGDVVSAWDVRVGHVGYVVSAWHRQDLNNNMHD